MSFRIIGTSRVRADLIVYVIAPSTLAAAAAQPSLSTLIAQAKQLEFQINALSEQYDGLRIQLGRAQADAQIAQRAAVRDATALAIGQQAVAQLAAENYMNAGLDPTLQALTTGNPEQFLVFFFADISHVGIYLGDGLMVDAPDFGEVVRVEPVYWGALAGAVRIR